MSIKGLVYFLFLCQAICFNAYAEDSEKYDGEPSGDQCVNKEEPKSDNANNKVVYDDNNGISKHRDLYAIFGNPDAKIQISLKVQLVSDWKLYLGYTQQMFWELNQNSKPFKDIDFNPELFFRHSVSNAGFLRSVDFGILEHRSNGKGGTDSRAWSRSYVKFNTVTKFGDWTFNWDTKLFAIYKFAVDDPNQDIYDYMGFWEMRFALFNYFHPDEFVDRMEIYFAWNSGGRYSQVLKNGSQEIGIRFRLGWTNFNPSIFFQVYQGYNECMLSYNIRETAYRLGVAF